MTSNSPALPALPQDPPERQTSITSFLESHAASLTDSESYARSSLSRESTRSSSRNSGIYGEITRTFKKLQTQLLEEKRRADDAERRLAEVTAHLKAVNEARLRAMQDATQAREDLRLYKIQLDHAQGEIFRAQDAIAIVDRQRLSAEKEAAKNRSKARQLNETLLVQAAREEAWRVGLQDGLNRGRNIALAEISDAPFVGPADNTLLDEESEQESPDAEREEEFEFPINVQSAASSVRSRAVRDSRGPGPSIPGPSAVPPTSRPQSVQNFEQIRPVSVQNFNPSPRLLSTALPIPDNFIPSLDADNRIRIPPAFEFARTPERPASPQLPSEFERSMEALPIPPPPEPSASQNRRQGHRRNSSSGSSTLSALDIINEPFGGALRTPMSAIQEVASQYSGSPNPHSVDGDLSMRHQPSFSGSFHQPSSSYTPSAGQFVIEKRSTSRASFAPSHKASFQGASDTSTPPGIAIQPPSREASFETSFKADSLRGGSRQGTTSSPASQASQIRILPPYAGDSRSNPPSVRNGMPGGLTNIDLSTPTDPVPSSSQYRARSPRRSSRLAEEIREEEDAVSSALSAGTLTTPPGRYRAFGLEGGDAAGSASVMGRPPSVVSRLGSVNTAVYSAPDSAATEDMTGIGAMNQTKKKGKKKK